MVTRITYVLVEQRRSITPSENEKNDYNYIHTWKLVKTIAYLSITFQKHLLYTVKPIKIRYSIKYTQKIQVYLKSSSRAALGCSSYSVQCAPSSREAFFLICQISYHDPCLCSVALTPRCFINVPHRSSHPDATITDTKFIKIGQRNVETHHFRFELSCHL